MNQEPTVRKTLTVATCWTCNFTVSGSNILIEVRTPSNNITVYWVGTIEYQSVSTDA